MRVAIPAFAFKSLAQRYRTVIKGRLLELIRWTSTCSMAAFAELHGDSREMMCVQPVNTTWLLGCTGTEVTTCARTREVECS